MELSSSKKNAIQEALINYASNPSALSWDTVGIIEQIVAGDFYPAISLRDVFAAHALGGIMANPALCGSPESSMAESSYLAADAMMKRRESEDAN